MGSSFADLGSGSQQAVHCGDRRQVGAFIQQGGLSTWDIAAAGLIAERAGARVTAIDDGPWFDVSRPPTALGLIAAPPAHHPMLLGLVR